MTELTQARLKELLHYDADTGVFTWQKTFCSGKIKQGSVAGSTEKTDYVHIQIDRVKHYAHRLAWLYLYGGTVSPNYEIDHKNRIKSDNRLLNLRLCTPTQNQANTSMRTDNSSGFRGVCWKKQANKWQASCRTSGIQKYLGLFDTKEEAHKAYCDYAYKKFGIFFDYTETISKTTNCGGAVKEST